MKNTHITHPFPETSKEIFDSEEPVAVRTNPGGNREVEEIRMAFHLHPVTVGVIKNLGEEDEIIVID